MSAPLLSQGQATDESEREEKDTQQNSKTSEIFLQSSDSTSRASSDEDDVWLLLN
jgi:hypothetical protein